jgi:serine acetyltransferase
MGDVEIGEGAAIGPHEVILPKSRLPAGRKPYEKIEEQANPEKR